MPSDPPPTDATVTVSWDDHYPALSATKLLVGASSGNDHVKLG